MSKVTKTIRMSVNKVILLGNVGKEPDIRYFDRQRGVANFSLATNERTASGEVTEWHNITAFDRLATVTEKMVHKGTKLYIEGRLRTRQFTDRENRMHSVTEIIADVMEILSPRSVDNDDKHQESNSTLGEPPAKPDDEGAFDVK